MKYEVEKLSDGLEVRVTDVQGRESQLLEAFRECQEGRCSCPTQEYTKLETLQVEYDSGTINLSLKAKNGQQFDETEIARCLDHTQKRVERRS